MSTEASFRAAGADIRKKSSRLSSELKSAPKKAVNAAALATKESVAGFLGGNSILLSGVGRRGAKVGVRYDIKGTSNPSALVYATGPFQLVERDTKAHLIEPRKRRRKAGGRAIGAGKLNTESGWAARANHPGTKGKHPFAKGVARAAPVVERIYASEVRRAQRKAFGAKA